MATPSAVPSNPRIYHILRVDRLASVVRDGYLWCDAEVQRRSSAGTTIGMEEIKRRRLEDLTLASHPDLHVGDCTPFYFCPRSVMLYVIHKANHQSLTYRGGQGTVIHLEADLLRTVQWAETNGRKWAFTLTNAGSHFFEDRGDLSRLGEIDWTAVQARDWRQCSDGKQAEFLVEHSFPWTLVDRIGVHSSTVATQVSNAIASHSHRPPIEVKPDWYY
jgi:hypothetical protein